MKKVMFVLLASALLFATTSCNQKEEIARLKAKNDSLLAIGFQKDTTVMEFVRTFNDIQANLDSIKRKENIITQSAQGGEIRTNTKQQISGDINAIYTMLQKNREMVAGLRAKLKSAESKLSGSNVKLSELRTMIDNMTRQIEEKDKEIKDLRSQLEKANVEVAQLGTQVSSLSENVEDLSAQNRARQEEMDKQTTALHTAYYVIGTTRELKEKKIINAEGGFIGIGRSKSLADNFDKSYFTSIDITKVHSIPIMKKKATVITSHPSASYQIYGNKTADSLVIKDYDRFWNASKYLVIIAE